MGIVTLFVASFIAGFLGTIVMTVGQEIQIRLMKRSVSYTPILVFFKVFHLDFDALSTRARVVVNYAVHFAYGTFWGFPLALFYSAGFIDFIPMLVTYFLIMWIQGLMVVSFLGDSGPPWTWGFKANLTEFFFKALYAIATLSFFLILLS